MGVGGVDRYIHLAFELYLYYFCEFKNYIIKNNFKHFPSHFQRVRLFDAYAMWAMCDAGLEILDVYPLSASYPHGTVDITHYNDEVFFAAEIELERYVVMAELEEKTIPVCME